MRSPTQVRMRCYCFALLFSLACLASTEAQDDTRARADAGEIQIKMYSLPGKGVTLRTGTSIRVKAFGVQSNTETTPLSLGVGQLPLRPEGADATGNVTTGIAVFKVSESLFDASGLKDNLPLSFQFEIDNVPVQTVLGAIIPRKGSVELNVVVPDPSPNRHIESMDRCVPYQMGCWVPYQMDCCVPYATCGCTCRCRWRRCR